MSLYARARLPPSPTPSLLTDLSFLALSLLGLRILPVAGMISQYIAQSRVVEELPLRIEKGKGHTCHSQLK